MPWLALIAQLPEEDPAARMRLLRTLESLGAAVLREGVYLLPNEADNQHSLATLAQYVSRSGGHAQVVKAGAVNAAQHEGFKRLFDRSARYEDLVKNVEALRIGFGHSDPGAIARVLHKQRRDFEGISQLDFFPSAARSRAERALAEAEAAVRELQFPGAQTPMVPGERLVARLWATRRPLWADRLASAWLVRRFIDPQGKVVWLDQAQDAPAEAIGFAFPGAHFAATEAHVAYEEMLARLQLEANVALTRIGAIVHFLELRGGIVPEAAGVQTLLQGARRRARSEDELLAEAEITFDLLYDAYSEPLR